MNLSGSINNLKFRWHVSRWITESAIKGHTFSCHVSWRPNEKIYWARISAIFEKNEKVWFTGMDTDKNICYRKAFGEFLEAHCFHLKNSNWELSRSGYCSHQTPNLAREGARLELFERDAFLMHYLVPSLKTTPFEHAKFDKGIQVVQLQCIDKSIHVVAAGLVDKNGYWTLGLGASKISVLDAATKACQETLILGPEQWLSNTQDLSSRQKVYLQHYKASQNNINISKLFSGEGSILLESFPQIPVDYVFEKAFADGFFISAARAPNIIPFSFGKTWLNSEYLVRDILKKRHLEISEFKVHPFL